MFDSIQKLFQSILENPLQYLVLAAIIVGVVFLIKKRAQNNRNTDWERVKEQKWAELQPHIENLNELYYNAIGVGGKIKLTQKKAAKESFEESKLEVHRFKQFCEDKRLSLPTGFEKVDELTGLTEHALQHPADALNNELKRSEDEYNEAYQIVNASGEQLLSLRQNTVTVIVKIESLINGIANHPKSFEKDFEIINVEKDKFRDTIQFGLEQKKNLEKSAVGAGAGVAAGTAVATMAPTVAMWVATTFGTASTGTAISALSGAAATNAALAWLGGGAVAAGGGGMAAGHALLALAGPVGWGIAGASLLTSVLLIWRRMKKIQESKRDEICRMKNCKEALQEVNGKIEVITIQTDSLSDRLQNQYQSLVYLNGFDYSTFSTEQKLALGALVNDTKALSALLNYTITTESE